MPKRVDPDSIDLLGGRAHGKKIATYAAQAKTASRPLLERAIREGSADVREAAVVALAGFDAEAALALVEAQLAGKVNKRERTSLVWCLFLVGTDAAVERALANTLAPRGGLAQLPGAGTARFHDAVVARLPNLADESYAWLLQEADLPSRCASPDVPHDVKRSACVAVLQEPRTPVVLVDAFECLLIGLGEFAAVVKRASENRLSFSTGARALLAGDPVRAYDVLAPVFREQPEKRRAIISQLDKRADPRWAHVVLAEIERDPSAVASALARLQALEELVDLAVRPTLDEIARYALWALGSVGDPRATDLLLGWLDSPEGDVRAPMLLSALADCGDARAIPTLEKRMASAGPRKAFYADTIARIRNRASV